ARSGRGSAMSFRRSRLEFTSPTKRAALDRSQGICECHRVPQLMALLDNKPRGVALPTGHIRFEHIVCDELRPDNSLDNAAALTTTCWRLKTDRYDLPVIAEAKRRFDRHHGIRPTPPEVLAGTFASGIKKTLTGAVIDR